MTLRIRERLADDARTVVPSGYRYLYMLRDGSGLHAFTLAGTGHVELFAKRKHAPAGWHLMRGAWCYEFVSSQNTRDAIQGMTG